MQIDTAGNPIYDQCAYCQLDTGGKHQLGCPCSVPPATIVKVRVALKIRCLKYDDEGKFIKEL